MISEENQEESVNIASIEKFIEEKKLDVLRAEKLEKLYKNKEFKELFLNGYLEEQPARLVKLLASTSMSHEGMIKDTVRELEGIGMFSEYIRVIQQMGKMAKSSIENAEYELIKIINNEE